MGKPVDDEEFCKRALTKAGIALIPGSLCFGDRSELKGNIRIGMGLDPEGVKQGLTALRKFIEEEYENIPVAPK
jgi:aspartate/methionine/tyrosine aminotransferase